MLTPNYWIEFIEKNGLIGMSCTIPEEHDLSELSGGTLQFLSLEDIEEETNEYYPGIGVSKAGFIAIASCLNGSGDPYFINLNDGPNGKLYRVYHDAKINNDGTYDLDEAVNVVLINYSEILKF